MESKGQVKMTETFAILIVFFVLILFGMIFYFQFQKGAIREQQMSAATDNAVDVAVMSSFLSEIQCSIDGVVKEGCVDLRKLEAASSVLGDNVDFYYDLFGNARVYVREVYPDAGRNWSLYDRPGEGLSNIVTPVPVYLYDSRDSSERKECFIKELVGECRFGVLYVEVFI